MFLVSEELVSPGGPSAPAWAFFTAITLALIGVYSQQIAARREAKATKQEAAQANENETIAKENTTNISNGFVDRVDFKLDDIRKAQSETNNALRKHLEWHLENDKKT